MTQDPWTADLLPRLDALAQVLEGRDNIMLPN